MSDQSPDLLLANNSAAHYGTQGGGVNPAAHGTFIDPVSQLLVALHSRDTMPVSIVAGGDIFSDAVISSVLQLPKQANIRAGQDIINVSADIQNQQITDTTSIVAGRDIIFKPVAGVFDQAGLTVNGPGQLILQAGRNVNLGSSSGVLTKGNLTNPLLPEQGADITVLAGVGPVDTTAFTNKYIDPAANTSYDADLIAYVSKFGAPSNQTQTADQAYKSFAGLTKSLRDAFVNQVYFSELRTTGRSAVHTGKYTAGYDAIAALFPGVADAGVNTGNLSLYNSQLKTLRGGNINILTPGGGVDAGLANANSGKKASELGVVTVKGGSVNAFVNNDFTVNQSRVFTIQGGDILIWSSYGNIDAGKGSKTASSTPPPLLVVDPKTGSFTVDATSSIVGSGIRVLLGNKDVVPGSVDLIAPTGTINAGDAGIGSAGNITLAAPHVIGADNINFSGTGAGVPVASVAPVSVSGVGNLQDANNAANQATQNLGNMNEVDIKEFTPTFLTIEVLQLGEKDDKADKKEKSI